MRGWIVAGALAASLLGPGAASVAAQGDPIMPLSELRQGMKCKGYSVVRGTEPAEFDVEILDIVGGETGARILVRVSGAAVDDTGIGPGFSGSPIYCEDDRGTPKNAGAISESIGEYGGKTVLATPIEQILAATPEPAEPSGRDLLAAPLTVRGLDRGIFLALREAARRQGRLLIQAPPISLRQAQTSPLKPGSAVGIGLSSGDVALGAVGTVAYVDGQRVYSLGHQFDGVGARNLLLQSAYVAAVINNPVQLGEFSGTYKLAGPVDDIGTVTNDTFGAVSGRLGGLPATIPVQVFTRDEPSKREQTTDVRVADETDLANPTGSSNVGFIAPVAVAQGAASMYDSVPGRLKGDVCLRVTLKERARPVRICNRYVSDGTGSVAEAGNIVSSRSSSDLAEILGLIEAYKPAPLHVTSVTARVRLRRGQHQAFIRKVTLPRRVRRGQRMRVRLLVQKVRGERRTITFTMRAPRRRGQREIVFRGSEADSADDSLFGTITLDLGGGDEDEQDTTGPRTLKQLVRKIRKVQQYDGIRAMGRRVYRDEDLRIGGRASAVVKVR